METAMKGTDVASLDQSGAEAIIDVITDPSLSAEQKMARISPTVPFNGAAAEQAVEHLAIAAGLDPDDLDLCRRVSALLTDPDVPVEYAAELRARMRQIVDEVAAAEFLAINEKVIRAARERLGLESPTPATGHPAWEAGCIDGDSLLHLSRKWSATCNVGGQMTEMSAQVQQNDGEPADLWLSGGNGQVSVDDAEAYAKNILTAVALARQVNAARPAQTEAAA